MTKDELCRVIISKKIFVDEILPLSFGQECMIYKADEFSVSNEIIYIPDVYLNELTERSHPRCDNFQEYSDDVLSCSYTGKDFVDLCEGDVELARRLFDYVDWQHPSSALPEILNEDNPCFLCS